MVSGSIIAPVSQVYTSATLVVLFVGRKKCKGVISMPLYMEISQTIWKLLRRLAPFTRFPLSEMYDVEY
jgi:hypothetical protein